MFTERQKNAAVELLVAVKNLWVAPEVHHRIHGPRVLQALGEFSDATEEALHPKSVLESEPDFETETELESQPEPESVPKSISTVKA